MTEKDEIFVFDDDKNRKEAYDTIATLCDIVLNFKSLDGTDPSTTLDEFINSEVTPSVIIIDHFLHRSTGNLFRKGESLVTTMREKFPTTPIICVTAGKEECLKSINSSVFQDVFDDDFSKLGDYLPSLIDGYKKIINVKSVDCMLSLFNVQEIDKEIFLQNLPDEILSELENDGEFSSRTIHILYNWFRNTFYEQPGFLYDELWSSMTMGIELKHFKNYTEKLIGTKYNGIWSDASNPRWWKSSLIEMAMEKCTSLNQSIQEAGNIALDVRNFNFLNRL